MSMLDNIELLHSYYLADPASFRVAIKGYSSVSDMYRQIIQNVISELISTYSSFTDSTIAQLDMDGNLLYINREASFAQTKNDIKNLPGSVEKIGDEILVSDSGNKKVFVLNVTSKSYTNLIASFYNSVSLTADDLDFIEIVFGDVVIKASTSNKIWEYTSNKYITSFYLVPAETQEIIVDDDALRDANVFIRQGTTVKWVNNSNKPISIYSGKTYYDQFILTPDLSLYGKTFKSSIIQPGEIWSYKFVTVEETDFFIYPDILTGKITVTKDRLNANDQFVIVENDNLGKPFSSRVIQIDSWGNVIKSFAEAYIVNPRSAKPLLNKGMIISS